MTKSFMRGDKLEELEQMMMSIPGFTKRGYRREMVENQKFDSMSYRKLINSIKREIKCLKLKKRLENIAINFEDNLFVSDSHKKNFYNVFSNKNNSVDIVRTSHIGVVYLLTADEKLWQNAKKETDSYRCKFNEIRIKSMSPETYTLYKTAKTINSGIAHIKLNELEDEELVSERNFKLIIHAILISKYGAEVLQLNCIEDEKVGSQCQKKYKKHVAI